MSLFHFASLGVLVFTVGCEPPPLTDNGVVLSFGRQGMGPGEFGYPRGIAAAADGTFFIVDKTARIQRFNPDGACELVWAMPEKKAGKPVGLSVHADGRLFVADTHYHRVVVFDRDGQELARFGENGEGDGQFLLPTDIAFDDRGFIYVSEYGGNDRVTRWTPSLAFDGVFVAGEINGQVMRRPSAVVIDGAQTLWITDACNHRVLRFNLEGGLLAEFGGMGDGSGQMRYPYDLDIGPDGELMVCEYGNSRVQWFDTEGRSLGTWGGPGRSLGELNSPWGAAYGADGLIYVLDSQNARVQVVRL